jgi:Protein of unknown function (DUF616)/Nucleotide-diphospho-sugar transferase
MKKKINICGYRKLFMKKNCVFTAITNDKDKLVSENSKHDDWDYICFTDNFSLKSDFWNIIYIQKKENYLDCIKVSKFYKTNGFKCLPNYDKLIWKDANIRIIKNFENYVNNLTFDTDIVFVNHLKRISILEEFDAVVSKKFETAEMINKIKQRYTDFKYNYDNGLISANLMLFRHNERTIKFFSEWWNEIEKYSHRDQLSANFALSKNNNLKYKLLDYFSVFGNDFNIVTHNHSGILC